MIRPTQTLAFLTALSIPLAASILGLSEDRWTLCLIYPLLCLSLLLADSLMMLPLSSLQINIEAPSWIYLGQSAKFSFNLTSPLISRSTFFMASLETQGPLSALDLPFAKGQMREGSLNLCFELTPKRRGQLIIVSVRLYWRGPLGLSQALHKKQINLTLHCHQNVKGLHQKALAFFQREAISGLKTQPFSGEGSEFDSLVEFTHGMDNRLIDWKRSARHLALLAKEFRQEKNHQIILGFDIGRLTTEPLEGLPKIDHFVKAGLTLAWVCLMSGDMVGAVSFGLNFENFLKPGRGRNYFAKIQRFTASLDYRLEETNFTATLVELKNRLPHRSLIVIFTEFIDSITAEFLIEGLALLAKRHMVLFVTMPDAALIGLRNRKPESFIDMAGSIIADNFVRERAIVLERTARLGVFAIDAPPKSLSTAILNRYLIIKQRGLL